MFGLYILRSGYYILQKQFNSVAIRIIPFFQFSIGLRMLDASFDVFDFILFKKVFKSAIRIAVLVSLVCIEPKLRGN